MPALTADLIAQFEDILGPKGVISDTADQGQYLEEQRGLYRGSCDLVLRPGTTEEVAEVVKLCAANSIAITPQGGNTGLCGGAVANGGVILSLERLNKIKDLDPLNQTLTVEAGVILSTVQEAADEAGFLFPLSLGAEGSCMIGGNLSTNAGGVNVLRYGNSRDLVLGLEVVLADGRIWNGLKGLRKDNTGYDLKHLFMGAEGTLGIITAAVLKLFPKPNAKETVLLALPSLEDVNRLFCRAKEKMGDSLNAFELISSIAMEMTLKHIPGIQRPIEEAYPQYALLEFTSAGAAEDLRTAVEGFFEKIFEDEIVVDGILAESTAQGQELWRLRESIPEAQKEEGGSIKHDVSIPVSRIADFLVKATDLVEKELAGIRVCAFGHFGDGNIHFNLSQPEGMDKQAYLDQWDHFNRLVHDLVASMEGSFSAEHGIGQLKVGEMEKYKSPVELDLMRDIKRVLDPLKILNPGKIVK